MAAPERRLIGCNVIDPLLQVKKGEDYTLEIMARSLWFLKEIGHDAIEYSHACHWTEEECDAVRKLTERAGLRPWSLHEWSGGDVLKDADTREMRRQMDIAVRNALALNVGIIIHHPSGTSLDGEENRRRLEVEAELIATAWKPGVRFAVENGGALSGMEYMLALVETLGAEKSGICVDTGHAMLGDLGPARAIRMAGEWLITTHLHDNDGQADRHMPPGDGVVDWDEVVAALQEVGYPGCIMLELTDQPPAERRPGIESELARGARAAKWLAEKLPWPP